VRYYPAASPQTVASSLTVNGPITATSLTTTGALTIGGAIDHNGSQIGLFGKPLANEPTALTHITDSTGGVASNTVAALAAAALDVVAPASRADVNTQFATMNNSLASVIAKVNAILTKLESLGIIDV